MIAIRFRGGLAAALLAATALAVPAFAADNIASDLKQPLWYKPPSAKTMELAKIDDLSNTVVSDGEHGEKGVLASTLKISDDQIAKIRPATTRWRSRSAGSATTGRPSRPRA